MSAKPTTLIALKPAFHAGKRVKAGDTVEWHGSKLPSWGAPKGDVAFRPTGKPVLAGDTKPKATQEAVKRKTGGDNSPPVPLA